MIKIDLKKVIGQGTYYGGTPCIYYILPTYTMC